MMENVLSRSIRLIYAGGLVMGAGMSINAQAQTTDAPLQRVEITGSSIKRVAGETSLPVTVLKREDIDRTGATTAQDLVNMLPGNFGGSVTANNVGATGVASTANLRALGSQYTLVLLNGRRLANYAFGNSPVDLNSIPLSAIERIEVLRDGASALYGADAVAGVINFILRKDFQGIEVTAYATKPEKKGGETTDITITGGFGNLDTDRYNFLFSFGHESDSPLKARDRDFANTALRPDLGINKASPRNGVPNLNFTDTTGKKYVGVNPYRFNGCNLPEFALVIRDAKSCGTDYVKYIDLIPKQTHDNMVLRGVFQLNTDNQLYAEAVATRDDVTATYSPAPYTKSLVYPANGRFYPTSITLPDGSMVTPKGPISGTWRTVAGGGRTDLTATTNERVILGMKGTVVGWDYDTAVSFNKNDGTVYFGPGKFSYAKLTPLVSSGEINIFGSQDAKSLAALQNALLSGPENSALSKAREFDFRASKEVFAMPYGPVGFAFGGNVRKESLEQISFPVQASGDEVGGAGPIPSVTGSRIVTGVFAEATVPLYKNLEAQLAGRYDKYRNDFGSSFTNFSPKVSMKFTPLKELAFRGSYGRGFRAPTLYQNLRPFTAGNNTSSNFSDPIRCPNGVAITNTINAVGEIKDECNVQLDAAIEGNKDLQPEKSKQFSLGVVFQPTSYLSGSLDYWDIRINKAIAQLSENTVFNDPAANVNSFYRFNPQTDPDALNPIRGSTNKDFPLAYVYLPYSNTAQFYAAGLDLNLAFRQKLQTMGLAGLFTANLDGTYYSKHGYQFQGVPKVSDLGDYKDYGPVPRWRHVLTFQYATGPWVGSLTHNYSGGYKDFTNPASVGKPNYPAERQVSAYQTVDTQIGYKGFKGTTLVFGIKNLLDRDPPASRTEANFQTGYDAQFTNPLGRTYYLRAGYKF